MRGARGQLQGTHRRILIGAAALIGLLAAASTDLSAQSLNSPATLPSAFPANAPTIQASPTVTLTPTTLPSTQPAAAAVEVTAANPRKIIRNRESATTQGTTNQNGPNADAPAPSFDAGRVGGALALVIGLIFFLRWGSKKVFAVPTAGGANGLMQVVSRTPLAPRQQLLLVRVGRRLMVVGDSGGRLSSIGEIGDPDEVAALLGQAQAKRPERATSISFTSMLGRLTQRTKRRQPDADWDELNDAPAYSADNRSERDELLTGLHDYDDRDGPVALAGDSPFPKHVEPIEDDDLPPRDTPDAEAQAAVEAARFDIQALRAKLREVTGRLTDPPTDDADDVKKPFPPKKDREDEAGAA